MVHVHTRTSNEPTHSKQVRMCSRSVPQPNQVYTTGPHLVVPRNPWCHNWIHALLLMLQDKCVWCQKNAGFSIPKCKTLGPPWGQMSPTNLGGHTMGIPREVVWCHTHPQGFGPRRTPVSCGRQACPNPTQMDSLDRLLAWSFDVRKGSARTERMLCIDSKLLSTKLKANLVSFQLNTTHVAKWPSNLPKPQLQPWMSLYCNPPPGICLWHCCRQSLIHTLNILSFRYELRNSRVKLFRHWVFCQVLINIHHTVLPVFKTCMLKWAFN